ncbi:polysaccharide deacetylase family protein [Rhodoferax mekongensis]|uniref:Polysaccharide deacetylase family protein n=1 Tax=Rhodoferax mekongensis TaxID=3068341 RepID=A0ABZ0AY89_9BURK|nr:polysaccharide deacetylase family protein [Rhodoferax sp. TBRC 17307]WNO03709.1 polysaccharide deacetylase family protein [Rhodoferax sp. TBRC 17307]
MNIPILMYHQVDAPPPRGTPLRGLVVAPSSFTWQMKMLRLMGYKGLSMRDLEPYLKGERSGKVAGITFDDGYRNNVEHALPVLKQQGFTATCYGVSSLIGGTNSWDRGIVAEKPLMSLQDWQRWRDSGMDIGSHTRTHAKLTELPDEEARAQIFESKTELERALGCQVRHFCYPYGWHLPAHQQMACEAGYVTATTTHRGRVHAGADPYTLRRIMVARATNPLQFYWKVATDYEDRRG